MERPTRPPSRSAAGGQRWPGRFPTFIRDLDARRIPYLSHSKVATVERCPRCYLRQYIEGERLSSTAIATGTLFHRAAAALYEGLRAGKPVGHRRLHRRHPEPEEQPYLDGALSTLVQNAWADHEVVGVEELFFMDLARDLPPVIGVIDLVLRQGTAYVVADRKTSKRFADADAGQLQLYAEHVRRSRHVSRCTGTFDEYRLVPDIRRGRTPAFRGTTVPVAAASVRTLVQRYRCAWWTISMTHRERRAEVGAECW